jgi:two-component system OmpR family response regulator
VPPENAPAKGRILVAEDDPNLLELLTMDLRRQGYTVFAAEDGKAALLTALAEPLDLILMDVMMPHIDGYHLADEITSKLGVKAPRIMIMTSRDAAREKGIAIMSGAMEIVQKPFELANLRERIAALLAKPRPGA